MGGIGIAFLAGFLTVCNIVVGLVLVITFKKTLSDKNNEVIAASKREMDLIIKDLNNQTDRNITLFQDYTRELKAVIAEADRHTTIAKTEVEKLHQLQAQLFAERIQQSMPMQSSQSVPPRQNGRVTPANRAAERYMRTAAGMQPSYAVTDEGKKQVVHQGDLFEDAPLSSEPNVFTVSQDGAAYTSMPVIPFADAPAVSYAADPIVPKKDFGTLVRERYDRGESVEEIATALNRSTTEVQFALDMGA